MRPVFISISDTQKLSGERDGGRGLSAPMVKLSYRNMGFQRQVLGFVLHLLDLKWVLEMAESQNPDPCNSSVWCCPSSKAKDRRFRATRWKTKTKNGRDQLAKGCPLQVALNKPCGTGEPWKWYTTILDCQFSRRGRSSLQSSEDLSS